MLIRTLRIVIACCILWFAIVQSAHSQSTASQSTTSPTPANDLQSRARQALLQAAKFFHSQVAVEGGYVYRVSEDLKYREGEGVTDSQTVWVQPPGTPAVGMAYLRAYERTGESTLLAATRDAAHCLVRGQLHSGGWQDHIDFGEALRRKLAYRVDGPAGKKARNISTFDDDKTQSAVRFLISYDQATKFSDAKVHEAVSFALESILKSQFPNGGFAQAFEKPIDASQYNVTRAKYPESWPKEYPGGDYWWFYTLNDNNISRIIDTLLLADEVYTDDPRYRQAALRTADFLLLAQMPEPQPAWAQQYNFEMEPVWARKFEPPAISGSESQEIIRSLMRIYEVTGDKRYLETLPRALEYLKRSQIESGRLARFYELKSNRPLYMNREYQLTYEPNDLPTHYGFIVESSLDSLQKRLDRLVTAKWQAPKQHESRDGDRKTKCPTDAEILAVIEALDSRGAWVEEGRLIYHKKTDVKRVIKSDTFAHNLDLLSRYLAK